MAYTSNSVDKWRQAGTFHFWRFKENERNYPGWHIMVDAAASESMASLLRAMHDRAVSCDRGIVVTRPTDIVLRVPNNRGGSAAWSAPATLRFECSAEHPSAWSITADGAVVRWQCGISQLPTVIAAFEDPARHFDSSIGTGPVVWIWGVLPKSGVVTSRERAHAK